jgi:F-type H+-transporting ATPase subunit b
MNQKKLLTLVVCLLPLLIFMSEEEHHGGGSSELLGKAVNFLILFGGLGVLLYRPVKKYFEDKGRDVVTAMKEAENLRRESQNQLEDAQQRLDRMAEEVKTINRDAEEEGQKIKESILSHAKAEADKLKKYAKNEIDMLSRAGIGEIRGYVADLAVGKAEERLRKRIGDPEHRNLIDESIERLSQFYEKPSSH